MVSLDTSESRTRSVATTSSSMVEEQRDEGEGDEGSISRAQWRSRASHCCFRHAAQVRACVGMAMAVRWSVDAVTDDTDELVDGIRVARGGVAVNVNNAKATSASTR